MQVNATQAMLQAIGVGGRRSLPTAAALNWVLKDGLGRLGKLSFTASFGHTFDSDLKRVRFRTSALFTASLGLEMLTPLFPQHFLAMATLGNVARSIALAAYMATTPSIHRSFALTENLADVSAKGQVMLQAHGQAVFVSASEKHVQWAKVFVRAAWSMEDPAKRNVSGNGDASLTGKSQKRAQTVVADNLGLAMAVGLSAAFSKHPGIQRVLPLVTYPPLAILDLMAIYRELKAVHLQTLNQVAAPHSLLLILISALLLYMITPCRRPQHQSSTIFPRLKLFVGCAWRMHPQERMEIIAGHWLRHHKVPGPGEVSLAEGLFWSPQRAWCQLPLRLGSLREQAASPQELLAILHRNAAAAAGGYLLHVHSLRQPVVLQCLAPPKPALWLSLREDATSKDIVLGILQAIHMRSHLSRRECSSTAVTAAAQEASRKWALQQVDDVLTALAAQGWVTSHVLLGPHQRCTFSSALPMQPQALPQLPPPLLSSK
eukprot:SM000213S06811  [mRNA]  locus=s213:49493:53314:- [translate_table: standard]